MSPLDDLLERFRNKDRPALARLLTHVSRSEHVEAIRTALAGSSRKARVVAITGSAGVGNGGLTFDIVPGSPEASILYFRTDTTKLGAMMPLLGRSLTHARGAELLHAWIAAMPMTECVVGR